MELNIADAFATNAAAFRDRECVVFRDRRLTYGNIDERAARLAGFFIDHGITIHQDREHLAAWESGQDHVAIYAYNGNEYLEAMLASYKARAVPGNVNYRYVADELQYLLNDMRPAAIVVGGTFAPLLAAVLPSVPSVRVIVQIDDGSGNDLLPSAHEYEAIVGCHSAPPSTPATSPDDLYMLYTGGTTGMPKSVLWRQADIAVAALGATRADGSPYATLEELTDTAMSGGARVLPTAPFMHGAGHWTSFHAFLTGTTVVVQDVVDRLDPEDVWRCVEREKVTRLLMIGDSMARPLLDELERGSYDVSSLEYLTVGGAVTNVGLKERFVELIPDIAIVDTGGSSESGGQIVNVSSKKLGVTTGIFMPTAGTCVVSADRTRILASGDHEIGWLARRGPIPLGYLGDEKRTNDTFPFVEGERVTIPGDRARHLQDGTIELLGRDSVTINSGGEKIFAEEVEQALMNHPAIYDVVVCGRPSERWGQEVVALVQVRTGVVVEDEELLATAAKQLARYKLPKAIIRRDHIERSPVGKADYRWAKEQAALEAR